MLINMNPYIPTVETKMLIRHPVEEVFQAIIDPEITTNFWFTKSTGILESGKTVTWEWEMYNASAEVKVIEIIPNEKISIKWGTPETAVDFEFMRVKDNNTYVTIKNYGFQSTGNELIEAIKDSTGGFTSLLDGLKAFLEHGIQLNLVADKYPPLT
jgi:uncharacterized protein YndB with AHSA1/START domain